LLALLPLMLIFVATSVADALGCVDSAPPCPFLGFDLTQSLVVVLVLGLDGVAFLWPLDAAALAVWLVVACIAFVRWRCDRVEV
jgi:hypothetical protein